MGRKTKNLSVRDEFLILTNGKRSEKNYFETLRALFRSIYKIKVLFLNDGPEDLVRHAIKEKNEKNRVWCVFDKDEFPKNNIYQAINLAETNGIGIAFSNIAFEVWLIDHFQKCEAFKTADGLLKELDKFLKTEGYTEGYSKNDKEIIEKAFVPRLEQAIENADVVHQKRILDYRKTGRVDDKFPICDWNSYTNVHLLVEELKLEPKCED